MSRQIGNRRKAEFFDHCWPVAQLTALMANVYRDKDKKRDGFTVEDFMPKYGAPEEKQKQEQTPEEMFMLVRMLNAQMGGKGNI